MKNFTTKQLLKCTESRENAIDFLHFSEILQLNDMLLVDVGSKTFDEIVSLIKNNSGTNKVKKAALLIILEANRLIKTERYRYENGSVFEYNKHHNAYIFSEKMSKTNFNKMVRTYGMYI